MKFTVLGSTGFVGSHVAELARRNGHEVDCPARDEALNGRDLGHVIYAIGLTSDFRQRPHDTVTAHVTKLQQVLTSTSFDSLVYLSSTRVYARCCAAASTCERATAVSEEMPLPVLSSDFSDLYNLSKLMGESIGLTYGPRVKIARLSNVIGLDVNSDNFLISISRDCIQTGRVELKTSLDSSKDYISVQDVAEALLKIGVEGQQSIYNVASGTNTTHRQIVEQLIQLTGAEVVIAPNSPAVTFPPISITRMKDEFGFAPQGLETMMSSLVSDFRSHFSLQTDKCAA